MACLEAFIIYTAKGDPIIFRVYKNNVEYVIALLAVMYISSALFLYKRNCFISMYRGIAQTVHLMASRLFCFALMYID